MLAPIGSTIDIQTYKAYLEVCTGTSCAQYVSIVKKIQGETLQIMYPIVKILKGKTRLSFANNVTNNKDFENHAF